MDQYFTMRIAHSTDTSSLLELYPYDLAWNNDFGCRVMTQQLQAPWVDKLFWALYSCENMCPYRLREELAKRYKSFYERTQGERLEGIIPFSIDYSAVYTGIPRPPYVPGKRSDPPHQGPPLPHDSHTQRIS